MAERHTVEMLLLRPGIAGDREAVERLAEALRPARITWRRVGPDLHAIAEW